MVTFVDDDQPIAPGQLGDVVTAGDALHHCHIDDARGAAAAAAELADLSGAEIQVGGEPVAPLFDEWLAVDDHEGRYLVAGDESAADHGLARPGRRHEHSHVVGG